MRGLVWRRAAFYLLGAGCLIAGLFTGERIYFLVVAVQLLLLLCAYGMDFWTAFAFAYQQKLDRTETEKGETVTLTVDIFNDLPYPFPLMKVYLTGISPKDDQVFSFDLPAHSHITLTHTVPCPYRGEYPVGIEKLEIHDVFGLTKIPFSMSRRAYYRPIQVLVRPLRLTLSHLPGRNQDQKFFSGELLRLAPYGEDLAGVREYRPGDPPQRIHWKLSARQKLLLTRQFEVPNESGICLLVDNASPDLPAQPPFSKVMGKKKREAARQAWLSRREEQRYSADLCCTCAAALADFHLKQGRAIRLYPCSRNLACFSAQTAAAYPRLSRYLAQLPFSRELATATFEQLVGAVSRRNEQGAPLYLITSRVTEELCAAVEQAMKRGSSVVCLFTGSQRPLSFPSGATLLHIQEESQIQESLTHI